LKGFTKEEIAVFLFVAIYLLERIKKEEIKKGMKIV
jgi:hypothetical protein